VARCMAPSGSVTTYLGNATLDVAASGGVESWIALDAGHHPGGLGQGLVDGAPRPEHRVRLGDRSWPAAGTAIPTMNVDRRPIVQVEGISKRFAGASRGSEVVALEDIHLDVQRGEFVALLGPSGRGKTTLL